MREFKFNVIVPPDEELIQEFHKDLAEMMIEKYGAKTMKEVLRQIGALDKRAE